MKRITQNLKDLVSLLSIVSADWKDEHFLKVESLYSHIDNNLQYEEIVESILDSDFKAGKTLIRSILSLSKDEFDLELSTSIGGNGVKKYKSDQLMFINCLRNMGLDNQIQELTSKQYAWSDIISERLKSGRGSAIKGQNRGRGFEDSIELVVKEIFGENLYDTRCQFVGRIPTSSEKTDFAIPSKSNPQILIEAKAYGATGSKQTDIIGDVTRIINEKRDDTVFLLATDGLTWKNRQSDLNKLVKLQNEGKIYRIYTQKMFKELSNDLLQLKNELSI